MHVWGGGATMCLGCPTLPPACHGYPCFVVHPHSPSSACLECAAGCPCCVLRVLVQFWALGYAASSPDTEPPPFWLSPDALWGVAELLWVVLLIRNTRKYKRLATHGHELAAKSSLLPAFEPLLRALVPLLLIFLGVVVAMTVVVPLGVDDASPLFMVRAHGGASAGCPLTAGASSDTSYVRSRLRSCGGSYSRRCARAWRSCFSTSRCQRRRMRASPYSPACGRCSTPPPM